MNAIKWETYPDILVVGTNIIRTQTVEKTLTDAGSMLLAAGLEG